MHSFVMTCLLRVAEFCDCPVEHVDVIEEIHHWAEETESDTHS